MEKYILDENKTPVKSDLITWAKWYGTANRTVNKTTVGGLDISTVFLGLDHSFELGGKPMLFETMVFGENGDDYGCHRCSTWEEAEKQHNEVVNLIKETKN